MPKTATRASVPGETGLRNLGNTCFLNSVLQALGSIAEFRDYFIHMRWERSSHSKLRRRATAECLDSVRQHLSRRERSGTASRASAGSLLKSGIKRTSTGRILDGASSAVLVRGAVKDDKENGDETLAMRLHELLRVLWAGKWTVVTPVALLDTLKQLIPQLGTSEQQDAQEFLCAFFDCIEREAKATFHLKSNIVDSLFKGSILSRTICSRCHHMSERHEPIYDISLDIALERSSIVTSSYRSATSRYSVRNASSSSSSSNSKGINQPEAISLEQCLHSFTAEEVLEDQKYKCDKCSQCVDDAKRQIELLTLPRVVCIVLKRFLWASGNRCAKILNPVTFPEKLDFSPYMASESSDELEPDDYLNGFEIKGEPSDETDDLDHDQDISDDDDDDDQKQNGNLDGDDDDQMEDDDDKEDDRKRSQLFVGRLQAIVCHHGSRITSGHYTVFCRIDHAWVHFNDTFVTVVDYDMVKEVGAKNGYLFFYERIYGDRGSLAQNHARLTHSQILREPSNLDGPILTRTASKALINRLNSTEDESEPESDSGQDNSQPPNKRKRSSSTSTALSTASASAATVSLKKKAAVSTAKKATTASSKQKTLARVTPKAKPRTASKSTAATKRATQSTSAMETRSKSKTTNVKSTKATESSASTSKKQGRLRKRR